MPPGWGLAGGKTERGPYVAPKSPPPYARVFTLLYLYGIGMNYDRWSLEVRHLSSK